MRNPTLILLAAASGAAALSLAPLALAQTVQELTVTGRGPNGTPQSISETVSYADLNLTQPSDRSQLVQRVEDKANQICDRLNMPSPSPANLGHSCQEVAVRDAMSQVRQAYADASSAPSPGTNYATAASATVPATPASSARDASSYAQPVAATVTLDTVTNGPIPDTRANRARFGGPMSIAGKRTAPAGN
jgi:UrcA family protein